MDEGTEGMNALLALIGLGKDQLKGHCSKAWWVVSLLLIVPLCARQCCFFSQRDGFTIDLKWTQMTVLPVLVASLAWVIVLLWLEKRAGTRLLIGALLILHAIEMGIYHDQQVVAFRGPKFYKPTPAIQTVTPLIEPGERVIGYRPMALEPADIHDKFMPSSLFPNLASLHRLPDVNGFDPLIPRTFVELIESTVGRRDDFGSQRFLVVRTALHPVLEYLGVRYVVGNPYEVRCRGRTFVVGPKGKPVILPVEVPRPVVGIGLVSFVDAPKDLPRGACAARIIGTRGNKPVVEVPILVGEHTQSWLAPERSGATNSYPLVVQTWASWKAGREEKYRAYYSKIRWDTPVQLDSLTLQAGDTGRNFIAHTVTVILADDGSFRELLPDAILPLYERTQPVHPAWLVNNVEISEGIPPSAFWEKRSAWQNTVYVPKIQEGIAQGKEGSSVTLVECLSRRWFYKVQAQTESILVTNQIHYPGWQARLDGQEAEVIICNGLFRGVRVPAGSSEVEFIFRPKDLLLGGMTSLASILCVIFILLLSL